jgi:peptide-methionine (S)-S-oxide reductase
MRIRSILAVAGCFLASFGLNSCEQNMAGDDPKQPAQPAPVGESSPATVTVDGKELGVITLGAGCFWCIEAVLEQIDGIESAESGYMGGAVENPTYKQICTGTTGHAEVVEVRFDPGKITLEGVLEKFWDLHDPTTLNRQGADVGTQYRSAIFYHSDEQKKTAEESKQKAGSKFEDPIVTEITRASQFYKAEDYHQDFYSHNKSNPYCRAVIVPKLDKLGLKR